MDGFLDDFFEEVAQKWTCPECQSKGKSAEVRLYQATLNTAMFFCETSGCLYPYTQGPDTFLVKRSVMDIPATEEMLRRGGLPLEMLQTDGLTVRHVHLLVWLKNFIPFIGQALDCLKTWNDLIASSSSSLGISRQDAIFNDPDIDKLLSLPEEVLDFATLYLKDDIKDIIANIKKTYRIS